MTPRTIRSSLSCLSSLLNGSVFFLLMVFLWEAISCQTLACTKYTSMWYFLNFALLLHDAICIKIAGGQWSKASLWPPGGRSYKGVTSRENCQ